MPIKQGVHVLNKLKIIILTFTALFIGAISAQPVAASTFSDINSVMDTLSSKTDAIFDHIYCGDSEQYLSAVDQYIDLLAENIDKLNDISKRADSIGLIPYVDNITAAVSEIRTAYIDEAEAIRSGAADSCDEVPDVDAAFLHLNAAIDNFNEYISDNPDATNIHDGDSTYVLYAALFYISIGFVVVSLGILINNLRKKGQQKYKELFDASKNLLIAAALALAGSGVTFFEYKSTTIGEEYTVFYGLIIVGYLIFFYNLYQYIRISLGTKKEGTKTATK